MIMYGHVGEGNLHVRPYIHKEGWEEITKRLADKCFRAVLETTAPSPGSTVWAGTGQSTCATEWGKKACAYFQEIKQIFDPQGSDEPGSGVHGQRPHGASAILVDSSIDRNAMMSDRLHIIKPGNNDGRTLLTCRKSSNNIGATRDCRLSDLIKTRAKIIFLVLIIAGIAVTFCISGNGVHDRSRPMSMDLYVLESTIMSVGMVMLCMGIILMKNGEDIFGTSITEMEKQRMHDDMHDQVMSEMRLSPKDLEIQRSLQETTTNCSSDRPSRYASSPFR